MIRKIVFLSLVFLTCARGLALADTAARLSEKGNELFRRRDFDGALRLYNEALIKTPESEYINFNIGASQFKKGDFEKAISSFEKSMLTQDKGLEQKANFNIANAKYKMGKLKENTDLSKTVELLRQSLDYYKRAIELDPKDKKAKVNHELVERELKILLDKLKQQQDDKEKQEKEKAGQQQDKQESQAQEQAKQGEAEDAGAQKESAQQQEKQEDKAEEPAKTEETKDQGAQKEAEQQQEQTAQAQTEQPQEENKKEAIVPEEEKKEGSKDTQEKKAQEEDKALSQEQKVQGQEASPEEAKEMSKEEANVLLEGFRQEDNMFGNIKDTRQGRIPEVSKDW